MQHVVTEGDMYYGHGYAGCFTCWSAGKVLKEINHGFSAEALDQAEVSLLLEVARQHEHAKPNHVVRVYEFKRAEGETRQTGL